MGCDTVLTGVLVLGGLWLAVKFFGGVARTAKEELETFSFNSTMKAQFMAAYDGLPPGFSYKSPILGAVSVLYYAVAIYDDRILMLDASRCTIHKIVHEIYFNDIIAWCCNDQLRILRKDKYIDEIQLRTKSDRIEFNVSIAIRSKLGKKEVNCERFEALASQRFR